MEYNELIHRTLPDGAMMTYGVVTGNKTVVLIKSGRGGDCCGHEDKYLRMAHEIRDSKGYTVICSPNPTDIETYDVDEDVIRRYTAREGWDTFDLRLIGSSNGGYQNILLADRMPEISRILCINMPLMINFHKLTRILATLAEEDKIFVYGTKDPSFSYLPFLENRRYPHFRLIRMQEVDHTFSHQTEEFVALGKLV